MRYIVDLIARYQSAWGFVSGTLAGEAEGLANAGIFKAGIAFNEAKWKDRNGNEAKYDAPVYAPTDWTWAEMVMKHEGKEMNFSFGSLKENSTGVFAPPPLMRFRRTKNITVTVIDGGNEAEVVENFGVNSWEIELDGLVVDMDEHGYPGEKVKLLAEFFEINDVIDVACPLLLDLGIRSIYFREQSFEPVEGFPDTVKYSLVAKSIKPAVFSLIQ
ncbi:DUF6046 domain-containing protein [Bacteroides cellulosilyticus]|uniref:DUF6046 domain-containing protein n=1 Tax=Bacteroides cellulosilyticus TaxID=246787 RepID=UPI001C1196E5|nr:DUF6046 domain-containing protein [Bacteroides cellulosilyticus]MBU5374969.1 hypothetical protein [Bacteroides cellulosilyticus]